MEHSQANTAGLLDRQQRSIAACLTHYKNIISLARMPEGVAASGSLEMAGSESFQMEVETTGLIRAVEDLLQLSRDLKQLWLFGPLRGLGEGEEEGQIAEDAKLVGAKLEALLKAQSEMRAESIRKAQAGDKMEV